MRLKESDIIRELEIQGALSPLVVDRINTNINNNAIDAIIEFSIPEGPSFKAAVELLSISTPKVIDEKINIFGNIKNELKRQELLPMIIAPYVSYKESKLLREQEICWIDLSGNMLITIPPVIYIERTGKSNKFPDTSPIKKIYEGTSSLVGRALLLCPEGFASLYEIADFIKQRNGAITLGTVSKVLKSLEEELIISKRESRISLKKPEILLDRLAEGYWNFAKRKRDREYRYELENINELEALLEEFQIDYVYSGFYAAKRKNLGMTDQITIFIKSMQEVKSALKRSSIAVTPDEEYGQVTFIESRNSCIWFNRRVRPDNMVDDLELYLELVNDKPRGPKIARQLKEQILRRFNGE